MTTLSSTRNRAVAGLLAFLVAAGGVVLTAPLANAAVVDPFAQVYDKVVYGDFLMAGNAVLRCPTGDATCAAGAARTDNTQVNDSFAMTYADVDSLPATFDSSSATVTIPPGATVDYALLSWGGSTGTTKRADGTLNASACTNAANAVSLPPGAASTQAVSLSVGAAAPVSIAPSEYSAITTAALTSGQQQLYSAETVVTNAFTTAPTGSALTITVGNVWAPQGRNCDGGWGLTLVYAYPDINVTYAPNRREVFVYDGHVMQFSTDPATNVSISGFRIAGGTAARVGVIAYEGDNGIGNDTLAVNGTNIAEPTTGATNNFFNSTAERQASPNTPNNYNIDVKSFNVSSAVIKPGDTTATVTFATSGDSYLAQRVVLSTPIPDLRITKTVAPSQARPGDTVTFTISVNNPSAVSASNVQVADALTPACSRTIGTLNAGATTTYTCTAAAPANDFTNVAVATGATSLGDPLTDTASAPLDVIHPSVGLTKTADKAAYRTGDTVTFTLTASNTGDVPISGVTVTDAKVPGCNRTIAGLAVAATTSWTCTTTAPVAGGSNTATVTANDPAGVAVTGLATVATPTIAPDLTLTKSVSPAIVHAGDATTFTLTARNTGDSTLTSVTVADPLVPACARTFPVLTVGQVQTWTCAYTATTTDLVNVATATATDGSGATLTRSATVTLDVVHPALSIVKTTTQARYRAGDAVVFSVRLRNIGDVPLSSTAAVDPTLADCDRTVGALPVGADITWTCNGTAGTGDYVNAINAAGTDALGATVRDTSSVTVDVVTPGIALTKTAGPTQALVGESVTFTLTARNTGDVPLTGVTVDDASASGCARTIGALAIGATQTWTCTVTAGTDDFTNTATVTATPPFGAAVTDTATAAVDVIHPAMTVTKTASRAVVRTGDDVTYTVVVQNTGDVTLDPVTLVDPLAPGCSVAAGPLAAGASRTVTCLQAAGATSFVNRVAVTATPPHGPDLTATASAPVTVVHPAVTVTKTALTPVVHAGDTVTFRVAVTNTGDTDLTGVAVADGQAPDCARTLPDLVVAGSATYTCVMTSPADDVTNRAVVTAAAPGGAPLTDTGSAAVDVIHPAVRLTASASPTQVRQGDTVTFTVTARNTGDVDLTSVTVTDALVPACSRTFGSLAVGAVQTWTCTLTAPADDVVNLATIGADDSLAARVTHTASAPVDVVHPGLVLAKSVSPSRVVAGDPVTYTLTVTDSGDVPLTGVDVVDAAVSGCDRTNLTLAAGETRTWSCVLNAPSASFTNNATATGTPSVGAAVTASASARLNVDQPSISVTKTALTTAARPGDAVTFHFVVTDTGDTPLTAVLSNDPAFATCDRSLPTPLNPGDTWVFDCTVTAPLDDVVNTAVASAQPPVGPRVTGTGQALVDVVHAELTVTKAAPSTPVRTGDSVPFSVTVKNTGDDVVTGIRLRDALAPGCDLDIPSLAVGATARATCTLVAPADDIVNSAVATGTDSSGATVTSTGTAAVDVMHPGITLTKFGPPAAVRQGQTVTWSVRATNSGDVTLTGVTVTDPSATGCAIASVTLAPGQSATSTCSQPAGAADMTNTAAATGDDPSGRAVTDSASAGADVIAPSIAVAVSVPSAPVLAGTPVTVTITVTNDGDTPLSGVTLSAAALPGCDQVVGALAIGASSTYSCVVTAPADDLSVAVLAVGTPPAGAVVAATAGTVVDVVHPAVSIVLDGPAGPVHAGDVVTFTVTVTNTGDSSLAPLATTVPGAAACDRNITTLAPGATTTWTCTRTAPADDITATATVVGTDITGGTVTASDPAPVDVIHPAVTITVTSPVLPVDAGNRATFTVAVTNTGDVPLSGLAVDVPGLAGCTRNVGALSAGASATYTCSSPVLTTDVSTTATVTGTDPTGLTVSANDPATTTVVHPAMSLTKTGPAGPVHVGDTVTFTLTLSNTGDSAWTMVTVTDPTLPGCDQAVGTLAVGAASSWTCTTTAGAADFTNVATAFGVDASGATGSTTGRALVDVVHPDLQLTLTGPTSPVHAGDPVTFLVVLTNVGDIALSGVAVADAVVPGCDRDASTFAALTSMAAGSTVSWSCTTIAPADGVTTTAVATATDDQGTVLTRSAQAALDVVHPALTISKSGPTAAVRTGDTVTFTIDVRNSGDVPLTGVRVADPLAPDCVRGPRALAVGQTWSFTCTMTAPADDIANVATVSGDDPLGLTQRATDDAPVDVMHPAVRLVKRAQTLPARPGTSATFTLTVLNTGDVTLHDISVSDPSVADCSRPVRDLPVDDAVTWTCTGVAPASDLTNVASVTGTDPSGRTVTDTGTAVLTVIHPAVRLTETGPSAPVHPGDPVTFTLVLTNTGDVALSNLVVTDATTGCARTVATLAAGASLTWSCSTTARADDVVDSASVTADDPSGSQVSDSASAPVDVVHPALSVTKTGPALPVRPGDAVPFTIVVTNSGDVDLRAVTLSDPLAAGCDTTIGLLAAGAARTVGCTTTAPANDFVNTATASGDDVTGRTVRASGAAAVDVVSPNINVVMTGPGAPVRAGDPVTFTFVLTNNGNSPLSMVNVTDPGGLLAAGCDRSFAVLAPGDVRTWTCTMPAGPDDVLASATATGLDAALRPVSDTGSAPVDVIHPALTVTLTGPTAPVRVGDPVTYRVTVLNTGDARLSSVAVADPLLPACDRTATDLPTLASLAPGASVSYTCTVPAPLDDLVDVVTAAGTDSTSRPVTAVASAPLDVIHPAVAIDIVGPSAPVHAGDVVIFTVTVRNTGDAVVDAVTVDDPLVADCVRNLGTMAPGETRVYTCTVTAGTVDIATTVSAIGTDVTVGTATASARAAFDVIAPLLALSATVPPVAVHAGDIVLMTVTVTNTGDVGLTGVDAGAGLPGGCSRTLGTLAPGETRTWTCPVVAPADDIVWTGTASGTDPVGTVVNDTTSPALDVIHPAVAIIATGPTAPVHPGDPVTYVLTARNVGDVDLSSVDVTIADPALAACARTLGTLATGGSVRWTCTVPAPAADVASASTIVGTDPVGTAVTASAPLTLGVLHPSVTVAITPPTVPVRPGEPVTFTVTVTNTGDVPLTDVRTTSADLPACDRTFPALAPGESRTYSCTLAAAVDDVTVAVVVVGTDPAGTDVRDRAASVVDVVRPGLDVSLTGPAIAVHQGDPITFTVTVTNNGDSPVTGVVVDDPLVPGCSRTVGTLAAGETRTWTCTMPAGADDIVDAVTATGVGADVRTLTDTATAPVDVTHPSLSVVVTVLGGPVRAGDLVTVLVTVTNTGDVPLTGVVLADPLPGCDPHIGDLAPGQQVVLRCIVTAPQDDLHPLATADGTDPLGKPTTAKDSSTLDVVHPAVVVRKTVDSDSVAAGAKVRFTVTVHNTGDVTLHDVVVSDPLAAGCSWTVPVLAPGQHRSRSCSMVADATFVNHAAATARPVLGVGVLGRQVGAADAAKVHVRGVKHGRTPTTGTPGSPSTPSSPADPAALPHTGGDAPRLLGLGLSLLGAGVLALVAGRRPRRRSKHAR